MSAQKGYYRYPTIYKNQIVFVSEGDLWIVSKTGGIARRLTTDMGECTHPMFSPDGQWIAFSGTHEGVKDIYLMPATGGASRRLTYLDGESHVVGWKDARTIVFASAHAFPFSRNNEIFQVSIKGEFPQRIQVGPANYFSCGKGGSQAIQRHGSREFSHWKRYRGGTAGEIWVKPSEKKPFQKFLNLNSNMARPIIIEDRVYFLSDHEGMGRLYSATLDGKGLREEAFVKDYYIRNQATDGETIVYHAGGDIYIFDLKLGISEKVAIEYLSSYSHRQRKFVNPGSYLQDFHLHPHGHHLTLTARGSSFVFSNFEGSVLNFAKGGEIRYRLSRWLNDGKRLIVVSDADGDERLEIYDAATGKQLSSMKKSVVGRIQEMCISPTEDALVLQNHKSELIYVNLKSWKTKILDRSEFGPLSGMNWSPDGQWVTYSCTKNRHVSVIKVVNVKTGDIHEVTRPVLQDVAPCFDPEGKYLYFIGYREFDPVWDSLQFELSFPKGSRPYLITLQKDSEDPFKDKPKNLDEDSNSEEEEEDSKEKTKKATKKKPHIRIDFEGIQDRILAFPLSEGLYGDILALKGKAMFMVSSVRGVLDQDEEDDEHGSARGYALKVYDFESHKAETLITEVTDLEISQDHQWIVYSDTDNELRVVKAGEKPDDSEEASAKKAGWIDLDRVKVPVHPEAEWKQIYKEAWRLQRDNFWVEDMSKVNWLKVYNRYLPLIDRVGTRQELSDVLWEMQGELGTSHAYVMGGDQKRAPHYSIGKLGADFEYDKSVKGYRICKIYKGDPWYKNASSPLCHAGLNINEGDVLKSIAGVQLSESITPGEALFNQASHEVSLEVADKSGKKSRTVTVRSVRSEQKARYREWVEHNRAYVHKKSGNKLGYVHIPDMSSWGFSEFHRYFLAECEHDGMIVDVRFNGGGNVSSLLLEKLARKHLGYDLTRWFGHEPYPKDAVAGALVAITNEYAGSDGDMFSHNFKVMKLGPLLGKRTWGGVIGIWPRHSLVDKGVTTQPEFSFWFKDVGWKIENYGVEPDIEVEITPEQYADGQDPQLDKGIQEALALLKKNPVVEPDFTNKPNLALPE